MSKLSSPMRVWGYAPFTDTLLSSKYAAFFKTTTSMRKVINKYEILKDASPVIVSSERARIIGKHTAQPRFQCIDENDLNQADIRAQCMPLGTTSGFESRPPLVVFPGTEIIAVCPSFFQLNQYRQPQREGGSALLCPPLGGDGKFPPGNGVLLISGFGYAIHALVLLKNRELWDGRVNWNQIFDIQHAVELSARYSLLNAESYAFYAGAVQAGCTTFPKMKGRFDGELKARSMFIA
ncbi:MAG: hypothetical protein L6R36_006226 [Xanthoria steineri]|nr:MAG: hypothetical protein L6R36_006226 [Xanthoria steineri]